MIKPTSQKQTKMSKNLKLLILKLLILKLLILKLLILNDLMMLGTYRLKIF